MIYEYIRQNNKLIGVVVALDADRIGWSVCNPKDYFDKETGLKIAIQRAESESDATKDYLACKIPMRNEVVRTTEVHYGDGQSSIKRVRTYIERNIVEQACKKMAARAKAYYRANDVVGV